MGTSSCSEPGGVTGPLGRTAGLEILGSVGGEPRGGRTREITEHVGDARSTHAAWAVRAGGSESRSVRWFSLALLAAPMALGGALVASGAPLPRLAPVLLLSVATALCVNRFAFFPSELAATAEAAVLLAAVTGFRDAAPFLGPLMIALLVGPLDMLHWEQRSFVRMAYNAGNRGLSVLSASAAFAAVDALAGSDPAASGVAVAAAATAFTVVDSGLSATLLVLLGETGRAALRQLLDIDALTPPLALYGGAVGFLTPAFGWVWVVLALVPAAFAPELVLARARRGTLVRKAALVVEVVAGLVALALLVPVPGAAALAVLVVLGVLTGGEFAVDPRAPVAPLVGLAVVGGIVITPGGAAFFSAVLVAVIATLTAWTGQTLRERTRVFGGVAIAAGAASLAAAVVEGGRGSMAAPLVVAMTGGAAFEVVAVLAGSDRRRRASELLWTAPVLAVAAAAACAWQVIALGGAPVFVVGVAGALLGVAWWGAPPWRSRVLGTRILLRSPGCHRAALVVISVVGWLAALAALLADAGQAQALLASGAVAFAETAVAMSLLGVRQWRFAPRRRLRDATLLLVAAGLVVGFFRSGIATAWLLLVISGALGLTLWIGLPIAGRCEQAAVRAHE